MKIGILGIKGVPGKHGVEVVVDSLLPHLAELGHAVTVYGYASYAQPAEDYKNATVVTVDGLSSKNLEMISHMWAAARDARKKNFDIIHIHSTDPCLLAWLPKARYGVVATSHGQAYERKKWSAAAKNMSRLAEHFFIRFPDVVTSVSKPLADYYYKKYRRPVNYIPNGVNMRDDVPSSDYLQKWGLSPKRYIFCSAGRFERTKGIHTLIKAHALLGTDMPLVIAGGGSGSDPEYMRQVRASASENVQFPGFLSGEEFFSLYAHAGIFIFPSEYEAMSMALLEGLSFGIPTIYSDIPENRAVAEGLGYAFSASDSESLSNQIKKVLSNYKEAIKIGKKAREVIRAKHDWANIAKMYSDLYFQMKDKTTEQLIRISAFEDNTGKK